MKYLKKFKSYYWYSEYIEGNTATLPNVSLISHPDYKNEYLTFEILETGTISFSKSGLQYSTDHETWTNLGTTPLSVNSGDIVFLKGTMTPEISNGIGSFSSTSRFNLSGNIMSLLYGDYFIGQEDLSEKNYAFKEIFKSTLLIDAYDLALPALNLSEGCYHSMFYSCTSLRKAPKLVAQTLKDRCYQFMFYGCTSLKEAPELSVKTLADYCYEGMFYGCTSLIKAPELNATTLADYCCQGMFYDCTSLIKAPELNATELADYCYQAMFRNCTSLEEAPDLPATTLADYCYEQMFRGCTSIVEAPELNATELADYCYQAMFYDCTSLIKAPELNATELADSCYQGMFYSCTSLIKAPELPATTLEIGCYQYMFRNCTKLNYIKCLATDISAQDCTYDWVRNVSPTGNFVKNYYMHDWTRGNHGIPIEWNVTNGNEPTEYEDMYMTFEVLEDGTIYFKFDDLCSGESPITVQYSTNEGQSWENITPSSQESFGYFYEGDKLLVKGDNSTYLYSKFGGTAKTKIYGNIMSLIYRDNFVGKTEFKSNTDQIFFLLFSDYQNLVDASNLVLPAITLSNLCYQGMFRGCTSLEKAPSELPATTLASSCYEHMFNGCTSLIQAPELPAETLAISCYYRMFYGCTSLNYIKCLATDISALGCTTSWVRNVARSGTFVKTPGVNWPSGDDGIPQRWTEVEATE